MTQPSLPGVPPIRPTREQKAAPPPTPSDEYLAEIRGGQRAMFMSAADIVATHQPHPGDMYALKVPLDEPAALWEAKAAAARVPSKAYGGSLTEHIIEHGVATPVHLAEKVVETRPRGEKFPYAGDEVSNTATVAGGHHRIAAMNQLAPDEPLVVRHWETPASAIDVGRIGAMRKANPEGDEIDATNYFPPRSPLSRVRQAYEDYERGARYD